MERNTKEHLRCTPSTHTMYRSLPRQVNWPQSRTQFQCCYTNSRCASMAASPTVGDVKSLNKLARQLKSQPVKLQHGPLNTPLRTPGSSDASHRNNDDGSSQGGMTVFLAESRERSSRDGMTYGRLIDYEGQKIKKTELSTTVAELYYFMKCFGSCQFLQGLWMDISSEIANIHMMIDANNLVTTASTIHLLEQKETIHMISMLWKEACSGSIHDLAHIPTQNCLADCTATARKPRCKTGLSHSTPAALSRQNWQLLLTTHLCARQAWLAPSLHAIWCSEIVSSGMLCASCRFSSSRCTPLVTRLHHPVDLCARGNDSRFERRRAQLQVSEFLTHSISQHGQSCFRRQTLLRLLMRYLIICTNGN